MPLACRLLLALGLTALVVLAPGPAARALDVTPFPPRGDNGPLPDLYDVYNALVPGSDFESNADLAGLFVPADALWLGGGQSVAVAISSSAENHNTFGLYTDEGKGKKRRPLLEDKTGWGFLGPVFYATIFSYEHDVGFYLETTGKNDDVWHSESDIDEDDTSIDHMASFALPQLVVLETDEGLLEIHQGLMIGWEDLRDRKSDGDYDDLVVVVGSLSPGQGGSVPEPATALLVGAGLIALAAAGWRRRG